MILDTFNKLTKCATFNFSNYNLELEPYKHQRCVLCKKMLVVLFSYSNSKAKYELSEIIDRDFLKLDEFYSENHTLEFSTIYTHEDVNYLENLKKSIDQAQSLGQGFVFHYGQVIKH